MNISNKIETAIAELALLLIQKKSMLVTAESCTGGLLAKYCTDIAGSSAWFAGGVVVYSNHLKQKLLDVSHNSLKNFGAVSEAVAMEMATGVCQFEQKNKNYYAISTTGIAGPGGGTKDKPVGTVCFAWAESSTTLPARVIQVKTKQFQGNRADVRQQSVLFALQELILTVR